MEHQPFRSVFPSKPAFASGISICVSRWRPRWATTCAWRKSCRNIRASQVLGMGPNPAGGPHWRFFFMVHQWGNEQHGIFHRYFPIAIRSFFGFREIFVEWVGFERNTAPEFSGSQRHDPTTPNGSNMVNPVARYQHAWTDRDTGWNLFPTKKLPVGSEWSNYHPFGYPKIFDLYSATCGPCVARLDRS